MQKFSLTANGESKTVWLKEHSSHQPTGPAAIAEVKTIFLFLDAELYLQRVQAVEVLEQLPNSSEVSWLFIESGNAAARHRDYVCNPDFTKFVGEQIPAWLGEHQVTSDQPTQFVLVGLSLSGLAALQVAVTYPHVFHAVISQSPSCWWNQEAFRRQFADSKTSNTTQQQTPKVWLSVGDAELDQNAVHAPSGMVQSSSQLESCQRTVVDMQTAGYCVHFHIYSGGHDYLCWRDELPTALAWSMSNSA